MNDNYKSKPPEEHSDPLLKPEVDNKRLERRIENAGITPNEVVDSSNEELQRRIEAHEENKQFIRAAPVFYSPDLTNEAYRPPSVLPGISANRTAVLAAEPGIGKSALALIMCMAVASGESIAGFTPMNTLGQTCLFISLEEETSEIVLRTAAIRKRYGADVKSYDFIIAGADRVKFLTNDDTIGTFMQHGEQELRDLINEYGAQFVILDPLSVWPIGEENNTNHGAFFQALNRICTDLSCTIMVIHHTRKPPPGFKFKKSGDDVRGSSSIVGAVRTLIMVNWATDHVVLHYEKCQYSRPPPDMQFSHSSEVITTKHGDYDTLVLAPYKGTELTPYELMQYKTALIHLFDIENSYRQSANAAHWIGYALALQMDIDIGANEANKDNRTAAQNQNRTKLNQTISLLERANLIQIEEVVMKYEKNQRKVTCYVPGKALHDD